MVEKKTAITVIGNSGIILLKLQSLKECDFNDLMNSSGLEEMDFYLAIGYLLNEGKIALDSTGNSIRVRLK